MLCPHRTRAADATEPEETRYNERSESVLGLESMPQRNRSATTLVDRATLNPLGSNSLASGSSLSQVGVNDGREAGRPYDVRDDGGGISRVGSVPPPPLPPLRSGDKLSPLPQGGGRGRGGGGSGLRGVAADSSLTLHLSESSMASMMSSKSGGDGGTPRRGGDRGGGAWGSSSEEGCGNGPLEASKSPRRFDTEGDRLKHLALFGSVSWMDDGDEVYLGEYQDLRAVNSNSSSSSNSNPYSI